MYRTKRMEGETICVEGKRMGGCMQTKGSRAKPKQFSVSISVSLLFPILFKLSIAAFNRIKVNLLLAAVQMKHERNTSV